MPFLTRNNFTHENHNGTPAEPTQLTIGSGPDVGLPDSVASQLVKTAPVVIQVCPLHLELYYDENLHKAIISPAVLILHVLRGDCVKNGTIKLVQDVLTYQNGIGPRHLFGSRKYTYNMATCRYFCAPSCQPV